MTWPDVRAWHAMPVLLILPLWEDPMSEANKVVGRWALGLNVAGPLTSTQHQCITSPVAYPLVTPQEPVRVWEGARVARPHSGWLKASEPHVIGSMARERRRCDSGRGSPE